MPFGMTIPEAQRIPELAERLLEQEAAGILRLAVLGCQAWLSSRLDEPQAVKNAVAKYRAAEDVMKAFLEELYVKEESARSSRREVYASYLKWCEESGLRPFSAKKVGGELQRLGVPGDDGDRFWLGSRKAEVLI